MRVNLNPTAICLERVAKRAVRRYGSRAPKKLHLGVMYGFAVIVGKIKWWMGDLRARNVDESVFINNTLHQRKVASGSEAC